MNDLIWQVPLAILTLFLTARSLLAPFLLDQEREKEIKSLTNTHHHIEDDLREKINKLEKALAPYTLQCGRRVAFASFYDEGNQLRQTYLVPENISDDAAKEWGNKVAQYLESIFDRSYVTRWTSDVGVLPRVLPNSSISPNNRGIYEFLSVRLEKLKGIPNLLND